MPFSDNLYSVEDSDADSFSDELTPADGYFNSNDGAFALPPGVMVQDPSIDLDDDKKPEAKVLIPTPNSQAPIRAGSRASSHSAIIQSSSSRTDVSHPPGESMLSSPHVRHSHIPLSQLSSQHAHVLSSENIPFMGGPPPAYTPSPTTSSEASEASRSERRYTPFAENYLQQGFLRPHRAESMGGSVNDEPNERTPLSDGTPGSSHRRIVAKHVLLLAALSLVISLVVTLTCTTFWRHKNPVADLRPQKGTLTDATRPYCPSATLQNEDEVYDFPVGSDLTVLQTSHDNGLPRYMAHVKTEGEIHLRRLPKDSEHGNRAHITVDVRVSDPKIHVIKTWDEHTRTLNVSTPRWIPLEPSKFCCVSLNITVWFPEGAELTNLLIQALTLDFRVFNDIKVKVSGRSKFTTTGSIFFPDLGDLQTSVKSIAGTEPSRILEDSGAPGQSLLSTRSGAEDIHPFSSREIVVETISGVIKGDYPLLDYLALSTVSGDIKVDVLPQEALPSAPAPADFEVRTTSGAILVNLPLADKMYTPPPRDYITNVHSISGNIGGVFYLGSLGSFKSTSGKLQFKALPIVQDNTSGNSRDTSRFKTHTASGSTDIEVLSPLFVFQPESTENQPFPRQQASPDPNSTIVDDDPCPNTPPNENQSTLISDPSKENESKKLRNLQSKHSSNSAMITVVYPEIWEGSIHATTVSGDITVQGDGLRTIWERKGLTYNELLARKGVENKGEGCVVEMSDISGELRFFLE